MRSIWMDAIADLRVRRGSENTNWVAHHSLSGDVWWWLFDGTSSMLHIRRMVHRCCSAGRRVWWGRVHERLRTIRMFGHGVRIWIDLECQCPWRCCCCCVRRCWNRDRFVVRRLSTHELSFFSVNRQHHPSLRFFSSNFPLSTLNITTLARVVVHPESDTCQRYTNGLERVQALVELNNSK